MLFLAPFRRASEMHSCIGECEDKFLHRETA